MPNYRIELHGFTIDPTIGTFRDVVTERLQGIEPALLGALVRSIIDIRGYLRLYVFADELPVAVFYRERADKLLRDLVPPVLSQLCLTAANEQFLRDAELLDLPKVFNGPRPLAPLEWREGTTLQAVHGEALSWFDEPSAAGAVVFHRNGEVMAAWERRHVGSCEPMLVAVNAAALP